MNSTVLITGASRGIGRQIALTLAENGYNIAINYHKSKQEANSLKNELISIGVDAACFQADVSRFDEVAAMHSSVKNRFGTVLALVNNAGISQSALFTDITDEMWDKMLGINLKGVFNCMKAFLPDMINEKKGKIINISSIWGQTGAAMEVHYSAAKAGVIGLTKALAKETAPSGITVNCICPGAIDTDMLSCLNKYEYANLCNEIPMGKIGTAKDVADAALYLLSSSADYITGQILAINGGLLI
ncbi:MAG TPA: 3-oxoacyl-ACP reductase FabG [Oscillospiraceae bacterium]|nr:3-oxoacyl-ACP reductase FabG [Oscillospiraceae bacterium]